MKHQNLGLKKLIRVKFTPKRDNEAEISSMSPSSEQMTRATAPNARFVISSRWIFDPNQLV